MAVFEPLQELSKVSELSWYRRCLHEDSATTAFLTTFATIVGSGMLVLPYSFQLSGWPAAIVTLVAGMALNLFTCCLLLEVAEQTGLFTLHETFKYLFCEQQSGRWRTVALRITEVSIMLNNYGSVITYFIVVRDRQIETVFEKVLNISWKEFAIKRYGACWMFGFAVIIFPLCHSRVISAMRYSALFNFIGAWYLAVYLPISHKPSSHSDSYTSVTFSGEMFSIALMLFAYTCQPTVGEVFRVTTTQDMRKMRRLSTGRKMLTATFFSCLGIYILVGTVGCFIFYRVESNVLLDDRFVKYESMPVLRTQVMIAIMLALACNIPLLLFPLRKLTYCLLFGRSAGEFSNLHNFIVAAALLFSGAVCAAVLKNSLQFVMASVGTISCSYACIALPCVLYLRAMPADKGKGMKVACWLVLVAVVPVCVLSLVCLFLPVRN